MTLIEVYFEVKQNSSLLFNEDRVGQIGRMVSFNNYTIGIQFDDGLTRFFHEWDLERVNMPKIKIITEPKDLPKSESVGG